jgi:PAS domain S-box-containing protein
MEQTLRDLIEIIHFTENVSAKIHGLVDEAEIYRTVKEEFAQSKQYTASLLLLTDDESSLRIAEASMTPEKLKAGEKAAGVRLKGYRIHLEKSSIYRQVVREEETVRASVSDIVGELFPRPLAYLISKTMGYERSSSILTPLKWHGKIIGALAMTSPDLAEYFIPSVSNLAQHISTALESAHEQTERKRAEEELREYRDHLEELVDERTAELKKANEQLQREITERRRSEEALQERTAQLEALREVGLELTAQLELDELLRSIVSRAVELLGGISGGIDLYRPELGVLEWAAAIGPDVAPIGTVIHRGGGVSGRVWETGEPLIVDDYQHWEGRAPSWEGIPITAIVGVPVRWGEEFLGSLIVHADPPRTFSEADAELLSLFATQAAIAIRNARLYEETHSRAERLAVVNHISRAVGTIVNLDDLMETVYQEVGSIFQADAFFIALYDEGDNELDFRLRVDKGIQEPREQRPLGIGLTAFVVSEKKPLLVRHFEKERGQLPEASLWGTMKAPSSWLGVPMLIGERLIGVICVQAYRPYVYGEEDELLLSTIADQVAVAVEQARLYEAERDQRDLAEALEEAAAALTATLDFDQVLDRILEQVGRVVPNDAANIMLIEGDQVRAVRWRGYERLDAGDLFSTLVLDLSELRGFQQMADSREPMAIPDVTTYPGWVQVHEWLRSYAGAPIVVHGEVIGFLSVDSASRGFFTQDHAEVLRAFADHAAAALENARLYEAECRRIAEFEALRQASLHLTSTLELQPILAAILDHTLKLVAADDAHVFLYDGERLAFGAALWEDGRRQGPYAEPRPQGLTYTVARSGERIVIPDVNRSPLFRDYQWGGAVVALPLRIGERVVGVMTVAFQRPHAFDESELRVLELLADQAAIAVENARLYEAVQQELAERKRGEAKLRQGEERYRALFAESQRQAQELALLNQVRTALASELDLPALFRTVVEAIADTYGYTLVSLYLLQDDVLVLQHQVGYDQVIERISIAQGVAGRVARTAEPVLLEDVRADATFLEAIEGVVSEVCVPLFDQGRVVGILNVESSKGMALGEVDLRLMTALSEHISVAIGRARLYTEVQESEDRYVDLYDNAPDMYFTVRRDGTVLSVNRLGAEMLGYQKEELIGKPVAVVFHPDDVASAQRQIDGIFKRKIDISKLDFRKIRKDGSVICVSERVSLQYDPQGEPILRMICRDITERKRAEEALRESEGRFQQVAENAQEWIWEVDAHGLYAYASPIVEKILGYKPEEVVGRKYFYDLFHPEDREELKKAAFEVFAQKQSFREFINRNVHKDGETVWLSTSGVPMLDGEGRLLGYRGSDIDITERKRSEEELQHTLAKLREALGGIIQTVALTVETRDPYTAGHQRRVSNLARAIANEMGLSREQVDGIRMAGLIHDLGKIAIPTEILVTPSRLNDLQWSMIKTHPQVGYDILKTIDFPWPLAEIVFQHHERMDGSGYPRGLSGEEIMLEARVLAVADVVEAMASFRPYRPSHGLDKALEEISQNRGLLYDPEAVEACLKLLTEKGFEIE